MSEGAYAPDKALWFGDRLDALRQGNHPPPVHVQLILSDLCNQDCCFCAYRMSGYSSNQLFSGPNGERNPVRFIPTEKAIEIIEDCSQMGVKALQFTGGGEPTVHKDFKRVISWAHWLGLKTALVTNGILLESKDLMDECMDCSWVRVSVDAAKPETYASMRHVPSSHWSLAISSIKALVNNKAIRKSDINIGLGFVVTKENWTEIVHFTQMAKDLGVDNVRLSGVFQPDGAKYFRDFFDAAVVLSREAEALSNEAFKVHNRFAEKVEDLEAGPPDYSYCGYQRFTTYIGGDLNLYRCCVTAYNDRGMLGSLKEKRFKDLWQEARPALENFDARGCPSCQFNIINKVISGVLAKPTHAEFV